MRPVIRAFLRTGSFRLFVIGGSIWVLAGCARGPEVYVSGGEQVLRTGGPDPAGGSRSQVGQATGREPAKPELFPPLPGRSGDGTVQGLGRWELEKLGDEALWEPVRVGVGQMAGGAKMLTIDPARGTEPVPLTAEERGRLAERLRLVPGWGERFRGVPVGKEWILQKSTITGGKGGRRKRLTVKFVSFGQGSWQGVRFDLREEVNRRLVKRHDLVISTGEAGDLLRLLER